jgi:hypothetical protein
MSGTIPLFSLYALMAWTWTTLLLYFTPKAVLELPSHNLLKDMPNEKSFHHKLQTAVGYILAAFHESI